ncbi:MAG TPA: hypothetical protein VIE63_02365 [Ramlibacter sp.]
MSDVSVVCWLKGDLPGYMSALERGWSADNLRPAAAAEELAQIRKDPEQFVASLDHRQGGGTPVTLPDGSTVPQLPGFRRWMWDGEFAGSIGLPYIELTTDAANVASLRVIAKAGGVLHEEFVKPAALGGAKSLRFRVNLA